MQTTIKPITKNNMTNLFETPELIPVNVQSLLDKWIEPDGCASYQQLAECLTELNKIGYTFEYELDGTPFNLRELKPNVKPGEFNPELFKQVFESNLMREFNAFKRKAFEEAIKIGNPIKTEEQTRQMAVKFFNKCLVNELADRLKYID